MVTRREPQGRRLRAQPASDGQPQGPGIMLVRRAHGNNDVWQLVGEVPGALMVAGACHHGPERRQGR